MSSDEYTNSKNDHSDDNQVPDSKHVEAGSGENTISLKEAHTATSEHHENYLKVVHTDGTVNYVDNRALGGDVDGMPAGYFRSPQFIGTVVVRDIEFPDDYCPSIFG
jgi:hypothetical protein